jgi:methyl-accepting chemotaxis protein
MSIKRRIWILPIVSTAILLIGLGVSTYLGKGALSDIDSIANKDYPVLEKTKLLSLDFQNLVNSFKDAVAEGDKEKLKDLESESLKIKKEIKDLALLAKNKQEYETASQEFEEYFNVAMDVTKKMLGVSEGDATTAIPEMQKTLKAIEDRLSKLNSMASANFNYAISSSQRDVNQLLITNIIVVIATSLILIVICHFVIKVIWNQLGGEPEYTREIAQSIADGDLSTTIIFDEKYSSSLLFTMKQMQQNLGLMIKNIKDVSSTIQNSSNEIASGNMDLSSRTEKQASSLEETATAIEELTSTVKQNADNAKVANNLIISSSDIATKGGEIVGDVVNTMKEINTSSQKISEIISIIDSIAFQTNILALNAAVEAARAGEQGRGFAVVASEVRNLAHRSASAAKEIKELINISNEKVNIGTGLVDKAGKTMNEIVASVKKVADLMSEISLASQEQSVGIEEVNKAIVNMDNMTQQNSALVEEVAASASVMQEQSEALFDSVSKFKA